MTRRLRSLLVRNLVVALAGVLSHGGGTVQADPPGGAGGAPPAPGQPLAAAELATRVRGAVDKGDRETLAALAAFPRLPEARAEAQALAERVPVEDRTLLLGAEASAERLLAALAPRLPPAGHARAGVPAYHARPRHWPR